MTYPVIESLSTQPKKAFDAKSPLTMLCLSLLMSLSLAQSDRSYLELTKIVQSGPIISKPIGL